jgi:hypothetical protein
MKALLKETMKVYEADSNKVSFQVVVGGRVDMKDVTEDDVIDEVANDANCKKSEVKLHSWKVVDSDYSDEESDDRLLDLFVDVTVSIPSRSVKLLSKNGLLEGASRKIDEADKRKYKVTIMGLNNKLADDYKYTMASTSDEALKNIVFKIAEDFNNKKISSNPNWQFLNVNVGKGALIFSKLREDPMSWDADEVK